MRNLGPIYVLDDDDALRGQLVETMICAGFETIGFASADEFFATGGSSQQVGCLLLDLQLPGLDGLGVLDRLGACRSNLSVVVISGHGSIQSAVQATKAGAIGFLEKPCSTAEIVRQASEGLLQSFERSCQSSSRDDACRRIARLSRQERLVLLGMTKGMLSKQIAHDMGLSTRTIEFYRQNLMRKLECRSAAVAVQLAHDAGLDDRPS